MTYEEQIIRKIEALLMRLKKVNDNLKKTYEMNDLRLAAVSPGNILQSYFFHIAMSTYTITHKEWWENAYGKDHPTQKDLEALQNLDNITKFAFFVFFLSDIEWSLRKFISHLFPGKSKPKTDRFVTIYKTLLKELNLVKYISLFDLCRHIRNTMHTKSIFVSHDGKDECVIWKNKTYSFKHMQHIDFVSHEFMFQRYEDLIDFLEVLLSHPLILTPEYLEDALQDSSYDVSSK